MACKGKIVRKVETGIPKCFVIQFEHLPDLELRVTLGKGATYKQVHRTLGTPDWEEAMKRFGPIYADIIQEPNRYSRETPAELQQLIDLFAEDQEQRLRNDEIAPGTLKGKMRSLYKRFIPFLKSKGLRTASQIQHDSFQDYPGWSKAGGMEASTVNVEIRHIKEFLYWVQRKHGYWKGTEWLIINIRKRGGGPKPNSAYTDEMVEAGMELCLEKCKDMAQSSYDRWLWKLFTQYWTLMMDCGARTSDPLHVQWKMVKIKGWNPNDPTTILEAVNDVHFPKSKTGPRDSVFQSGALINIKALYEERGFTLNPEDFVFMNIRTRKQMGPKPFNDRFNMIANALGWPEQYTLYSSRSTYISDRIIQGTPLSLIAQNVGNSVRVIEDDYKDIILKLHADPLTQRRTVESPAEEYSPLV